LEALLTSFAAAAAGEWGDKTQLLVIALAARYGRPGAILAGVLVAAISNSLLAAWAGGLVHAMVTIRAASLLLALAMVFAGVAGLIRPAKEEPEEPSRVGPFVATAFSFFLLEFGDKTQFLTFAIAAQFNAFAFAAAGATAGVMAASLPAALAGPQLAKRVPLAAIRYSVSGTFLLLGAVVGLSALRLL
jgi:putative Ca2+/H+ antiporter (TMEM165/GDT1 family)